MTRSRATGDDETVDDSSVRGSVHVQSVRGGKRKMHDVNVRFEVFTAVTMKNVVFWDIKTQFIPHRKHVTSPLQSPAC
jgi:hypothetical protein